MEPFLFRVAKMYFEAHNTDVRHFTFVFPNRRAGLFFQKYLTELIEKPIFSPEIISITDCFLKASERELSDRTAELFRLFRIFKQLSSSEETFDTFVFWGEMLIADFEDVDKYRVDPKQLFANVKGLKELDTIFDPFSEEQKKAISYFWEHFLPVSENQTREEFIAIWKILLPLYEEFRKELTQENRATEGMILREIADKLERDEMPEYFQGKQFVFIGFNALNPCEQVLFEELKKNGQADFYWDYESAEVIDADNQASRFSKKNTERFPSKYAIKHEISTLEAKSFELIAIPSAVGQAKEVYRLLEDFSPENQDEWIRTAIVLPDENLLLPLLHSLPENIERINVTMGYPLKATPVAGLLEHIFELHRRVNSKGTFYHLTVANILNHQYINMLCGDETHAILQQITEANAVYVDAPFFAENELLKLIFTPCKQTVEFVDYLLKVLKKLNLAWYNLSKETGKYRLECDFLYQYYIAINRMKDVMNVQNNTFEMSLDTLVRLIRQLVGGINIPFEGEPINGLQIMGMLETRGLDFENLIICSFNEGVFPTRNSSNSFIPYNLRQAFKMPVSDTHDAIAAYNFYRLIHRAKKIYFLYDSRTDGMQTGEVSRYFHQLHYHYAVDFKRIDVSYDVDFMPERTIEIAKTPEIQEKLSRFLKNEKDAPAFSATSINTYIDCPLQFYFTQVERIQEVDEVQETIEASMFGTLLHEVMENLYKPFEGKLINKNTLEEVAKNTLLIDKTITRAFATEFFKKKKDAEIDIELEGNYLLIARVIKKYVVQILRLDAEYAPFRYISSELPGRMLFPIRNGNVQVNLKGIIDRIDKKEGVIRILDYKSGAGSLDFKSMDELFEKNKDKRPKFVLQTFLYSLLYQYRFGNEQDITPSVLYVRDVFKDDFSMTLIDKSIKGQSRLVENFNEYREEFIEKLTICLEEIFNPEIPFTQCENQKPCEWCAYKTICRR